MVGVTSFFSGHLFIYLVYEKILSPNTLLIFLWHSALR